jgi:heterodisulfide reductase subunit B
MAEMKLRTRNLFGDMDLAVEMLRRNKLAFFPELARPPQKVKPVAAGKNTVAYYPGCSLHSTAREYDISTRAVCEALGLILAEPEGWLCCGSTAAHRLNPQMAYSLPMQNLALIEQSGLREVTMPCAACFNRHKAAVYQFRHPKEHAAADLGEIEYSDQVEIQTLIETLHKHFGPEAIKARTTHPLSGLRLVSYYGCLLTRPPQVTEAPNPENPTDMDELLQAAGAEILDWSYKTTCCGAAHSLSRPDIVYSLSKELLDQARSTGAQAIAVACPLCHMNLDARQIQMGLENPMPVYYFTQLLALAFGLPEKTAALNKNLVDPRPLLRELAILPAP